MHGVGCICVIQWLQYDASNTMHIYWCISYNALNIMYQIQFVTHNAYNWIHTIKCVE